MREILFRGKTKHGEWVEGWFVGKTRKAPYNPPQEKTAIISQDLYCYDVIPETVGQYTELTDRNGKRIFEGDIISSNWGYKGIVELDSIMYAKCECLFNEDCEIIGNIHDNPELL